MLYPVGCSWVHDAVPPTCIHLTWDLVLSSHTYILNITTPLSVRVMGNHLNQLLSYKTLKTANLKGQL